MRNDIKELAKAKLDELSLALTKGFMRNLIWCNTVCFIATIMLLLLKMLGVGVVANWPWWVVPAPLLGIPIAAVFVIILVHIATVTAVTILAFIEKDRMT